MRMLCLVNVLNNYKVIILASQSSVWRVKKQVQESDVEIPTVGSNPKRGRTRTHSRCIVILTGIPCLNTAPSSRTAHKLSDLSPEHDSAALCCEYVLWHVPNNCSGIALDAESATNKGVVPNSRSKRKTVLCKLLIAARFDRFIDACFD